MIHFYLHALTVNNNKQEIDALSSATSPPKFCNNIYSAFKRGNVIKGILCPSMTNSFRNSSLEKSYLTYSHRQRQKSLIIVNVVDFILKIVLAAVWIWRRDPAKVSEFNRNTKFDTNHTSFSQY